MNRIPAIFILLGIILTVLLRANIAAAQMQIGTNLAEVSAESTTPVFVDAFKMAAPWMTRSEDGAELNSNRKVKLLLNWPLESPFVDDEDNSKHVVYTLIPVHTAGDYILTLVGKGEIRIVIDGISTKYVLPEDGEITEDGKTIITVPINTINEGNGVPKQVYLELLKSTNSPDRIRDIHFYTPGFDENTIFHPDFVASLDPFDVLRLTDWGRTNSGAHDGTDKTDITQENAPLQTGPKGVAIELMAELANAAGKDVWCSVPHSASDKYAKSIAARFKAVLNEERKIYIEYSNETWNPKYPQYTYCQEQGELEMLGDENDANTGHKYTAVRSQEIWGNFLETFTESARDRLVFVLASQADSLSATQARSNALDPSGLQPDVIAIAPYFGRSYASSPTLSDILNDAQDDIGKLARLIQNHEIMTGNTLPVVAYAGGQRIMASDNARDDSNLVERLAEANRDPRMYNLYLDYLDVLNEAGIGLFNHYNHCERWDADGSWGALEYLNQPLSEAHKHRALLNWPEDEPTTEPAEDTQPPEEFTLSVANTTTSSVNLEWTQATDNVGVTDYIIYQDDALLNTVSSDRRAYPITGLTNSTDYTFVVEASDAVGNTRKSNTVAITTPAPSDDTEPPTAPVLRVTNQTATSVSLEWTPATDNDQVAFYYLFQGTELIATIEPDITNYTAEALPEATYTFVVKATDPANNASKSSNIVVVTISSDSPAIDRESPGAFQLTLAEATPDSLVLNWTTPTDNRGITQYIIYQDGQALESLESSTNSYSFTNLDADSTYTITVVAYDAAGNTSEATFTAVMPDLLAKELPEPEPELKVSAIQPQKLFSPNDDGQNDTWQIVVAPGYFLSTVQIYNRSGQKIFDAGENYPEQPWDGLWQGKPLATGAYYFVITYFNQEGQFTVTGSVALIR